MRTVSRRDFLALSAAAASGAGVIVPFSSWLRSAGPGLRTLAQDPAFPFHGPPILTTALGVSAQTHLAHDNGLDPIHVVNDPTPGPYLGVWFLGGALSSATYRLAGVDLNVDRVGPGYHLVEIFLGDLYPSLPLDRTPVEVPWKAASGYVLTRMQPRFATLGLPRKAIRCNAVFGGQPIAAFDLTLPEFDTRVV